MTTLRDLIGPNVSPAGYIAGYWERVPAWSLGGNDRYGDCTFVSLCNLIDLVTAVNGRSELVGEAEAEYFYSREAGFSPLDPATDKGAILEDVIRFWAEQGWPNEPTNKLVGWCAIGPDEIHQAVHSLGAVPAWCELPHFEDGGEWIFGDEALADNLVGVGPHAILIVESNPLGLRLVSWASVYEVSHEWWHAYGRGQFAVRHPEWRVP